MFKTEPDYTKSKDWLSTMLILRIPLKLLVRSEFLPNFSDMLNLYVYVLFGSLLFVVILAAARAFGADFLHHDILDHSVDAGIREVSHAEGSPDAQSNGDLHEASAGPGDKTGLVRFQGMVLMSFPARTSDGAIISSGDNAQIISMIGNIAVIQKRPNS